MFQLVSRRLSEGAHHLLGQGDSARIEKQADTTWRERLDAEDANADDHPDVHTTIHQAGAGFEKEKR